MNNRTLLGKPIRNITEILNPHKITLDEFVENVRNSALGWQSDLTRLDKKNTQEELWPEQWAESLLAWMEIEQEKH